MMLMRECVECRTWFRDSDGTGVCPVGHEPLPVDNEDEYPVGQVTI